jgi:O-acetyl-ADP-ribose deacetylase (regulator of RNase III)
MKVVICDIYKAFIDECSELIGDLENVTVHFGDIRDLRATEAAAYVSPANSFGSMGGGIDYLMNNEMFPGIQEAVMQKIAALETRTALKHSFDNLHRSIKPHLPIGCAMITPLTDYEDYETCFLVTAPTMICPEDVSNTDNAYLALSAAIRTAKAHGRIKVLICPGMCTGIGNMPPKKAADQMVRAIKENL